MSTFWSKPVRPAPDTLLFGVVEKPTDIRHLTPIERQRFEDGSQHSWGGVRCDSPPQPELYVSDAVSKSHTKSHKIEQPDEDLEDLEKMCDPDEVVKSYLRHGAK